MQIQRDKDKLINKKGVAYKCSSILLMSKDQSGKNRTKELIFGAIPKL